MNKKNKLFLMLILLIGMVVFKPDFVKADEMTIHFLSQNTVLKEEPSDSSKDIVALESGNALIVLEETDSEWIKVQSGEYLGYVKKEMVADAENTVTEEIKEQARTNELRLREAEYRIQQYKQTRIWGTIIVVLVVAIFATGIISTIRKEKANKLKDK